MNDSFYSQFNEDSFLVLNEKLPESGIFIDVGAGDPQLYSNSKHFEQKGWNVVCVEPDPRYYAKLIRERKCVEKVAIGTKEGNIDFWIAEDYGLSTTTPVSGIAYESPIKVSCITLDRLLQEDEIDHIDVLSVDTEGTELDVLDSLNIERYQPKYIIVEYNTVGIESRENVIRKYFENRPYDVVLKTKANLIFKRR